MDSPLTSQLRITAWPDAIIDGLGHLPDSAYFEWLWLPRIGPSTAWAYRRLADGLHAQPDGYDLDLATFGAWLGLGAGTGRQSPLVRSLQRLVRFHLAVEVDRTTLAVRRRVPPLTAAQLRHLPPSLARVHMRMANTTARPERARRAAAG